MIILYKGKDGIGEEENNYLILGVREQFFREIDKRGEKTADRRFNINSS